ncbi:hypothetical protein [Roseateles sp.]|uniref:hypothetical protein n=1 Tax=Roseateles sp. TaxID=1971397 RepID=UPI0032650521
MSRTRFVMAFAGLAALAGCSKTASDAPAPPAPPVAASAAPVAEVPAAWLGRWQGPEGTWLEIVGGPGTYRVTVQNLDGPRSFDAKAGSGTLVFFRDGRTETIRPGNGADTGMKWLADKRDCLVVKAGEGYCRK